MAAAYGLLNLIDEHTRESLAGACATLMVIVTGHPAHWPT